MKLKLLLSIVLVLAFAQFLSCQNLMLLTDKPNTTALSGNGLVPDSKPDPWFGQIVVTPSDDDHWIRVFGLAGTIPVDALERQLGYKLTALTVQVKNMNASEGSGFLRIAAHQVVLEGSMRGSFNLDPITLQPGRSVQANQGDLIALKLLELDLPVGMPILRVPPTFHTFAEAISIRTENPSTDNFEQLITTKGAFFYCNNAGEQRSCKKWFSGNGQLPIQQLQTAMMEPRTKKTIWIGGSQGDKILTRIDQGIEESQTSYSKDDLGLDNVKTLAWQPVASDAGYLWIASNSLNYAAYNVVRILRDPIGEGEPEGYSLGFTELAFSNRAKNKRVTSLLVDSRGTAWAGTAYTVNMKTGGAFDYWRTPSGSACAVYGLVETVSPASVWAASDCGLIEFSLQFPTSTILGNATLRTTVPAYSLTVDRNDGTLWVGTNEGVAHLSSDGSLALLDHASKGACPEDPPFRAVELFQSGVDGSLWITEDFVYDNKVSVYRMERSSGCFQKLFDRKFDKTNKPVSFLGQIDDLILLSTDLGQIAFKPNGCYHFQAGYDQAGSTIVGTIKSMLRLSTGEMLVGAENGLHLYDPSIDHFSNFMHFRESGSGLSPVSKMSEAADGSIWSQSYVSGRGIQQTISSTSMVRYVMDGPVLQTFPYESSDTVCPSNSVVIPNSPTVSGGAFESDDVTDIEKGIDGSIYFSTAGDVYNGIGYITKIEDDRFKSFPCANEDVFDLLITDTGLFYLTAGGIYRLDVLQDRCEMIYASAMPVLKLARTRSGTVWAILNPFEIAEIDGFNVTIKKLTNAPANQENSSAVFLEDGAGSIWVGTSEGLFRIDDGQVSLSLRCGAEIIRAGAEGGAVPLAPSARVLPSCSFNDMLQAESGEIYVATGGLDSLGGVTIISGSMVITLSNFLPGGLVTALSERKSDKGSEIWIGTDRGIAILSKQSIPIQ